MERDFLIEAYYAQEPDENESLAHHGVHGMHWGVRRYQNPDGSLTPEGRRHWGIGDKIRSAKSSIEKGIKQRKQAALRSKKNAIMARGNVEEILKNKHLFTTSELDKAIGRSQRMSMLESMSPEKQAQREKEIKAQAKAAKGREAVDRGMYRAAQLVQMTPALIQCGTIVAGLIRASQGHGPAPTPDQIINAVNGAANAGNNQNGSNNGGSGGGSNNGGSGGGNPPSGSNSGGSGGSGGGSNNGGGSGGNNGGNPPSGGNNGGSGGSHGNNGGSGHGNGGSHGNNNPGQVIVNATDLIIQSSPDMHNTQIGSLFRFNADSPGFDILSEQNYLNDATIIYD